MKSNTLKNRLSEYSLFFLTLAFYQSSAIIFLKISTHSVLPGHAAVVCTRLFRAVQKLMPSKAKDWHGK